MLSSNDIRNRVAAMAKQACLRRGEGEIMTRVRTGMFGVNFHKLLEDAGGAPVVLTALNEATPDMMATAGLPTAVPWASLLQAIMAMLAAFKPVAGAAVTEDPESDHKVCVAFCKANVELTSATLGTAWTKLIELIKAGTIQVLSTPDEIITALAYAGVTVPAPLVSAIHWMAALLLTYIHPAS